MKNDYKSIYYKDLEVIIDKAVADTIRETHTLCTAGDLQADCVLKNRMAGIFDLKDKLTDLLSKEDE